MRARASQKPWTDRLIDLRVEDHDHPLVELGRLLRLHRAYELMNRGDEAMAAGEMDRAFRMNPNWKLLVPRLPGVGQLPDDEELIGRILAVGP